MSVESKSSSDQALVYDAIVIGAGMSGIACAIRLNHFGLKVALVEKHSVLGGLNSYYQRVKFDVNGKRAGIRKFDVGLHALTNFSKKGERGKPLQKILKQLKIRYDDLNLKEQNYSLSWLGNKSLKFSNDLTVLKNEIKEKFPEENENFLKLLNFVENHNDLDVTDSSFTSANEFLSTLFKNNELKNLILFPILCYGSAWENDIDLNQFTILFRALYMEGFSRPLNGIRTIFDLLKDKLQNSQIDQYMKSGVQRIIKTSQGVEVITDKHTLLGSQVFSSIGYPETMEKLGETYDKKSIGKLSFVEVQFFFDRQIKSDDFPTVLFYSSKNDFKYERPIEFFDGDSAIICFPNNYQEYEGQEGLIRLTFMANYDLWDEFNESEYEDRKKEVENHGEKLIRSLYPNLDAEIVYKDTFTPLTITKFTSHFKGTVYGSTEKKKSGGIGIDGVDIIGTDQGFLGVTGSILSGLSMANKYAMEKVLK